MREDLQRVEHDHTFKTIEKDSTMEDLSHQLQLWKTSLNSLKQEASELAQAKQMQSHVAERYGSFVNQLREEVHVFCMKTLKQSGPSKGKKNHLIFEYAKCQDSLKSNILVKEERLHPLTRDLSSSRSELTKSTSQVCEQRTSLERISKMAAVSRYSQAKELVGTGHLHILRSIIGQHMVLQHSMEVVTILCDPSGTTGPEKLVARRGSPQTQNELIEVMGKHIVLLNIVDELKAASDIREEFLAFIGLDRITGAEIADAIITFLQDNDVPVANMWGQGYDSARIMSCDRVREKAQIQQSAPRATYVHCSEHCLNIVISKSCTLPDIRNVMDRLEYCCQFFLNSPKRSGILELIVTENVPDSPGRKRLLDLCRTRWAERHSAYQHFYQTYSFIVQALELIGYRRHLDKYGDKYADWDTVNRIEDQQILA
eukprot:Em0386g1a